MNSPKLSGHNISACDYGNAGPWSAGYKNSDLHVRACWAKDGGHPLSVQPEVMM
jgi:hypothetical protein